MTNTRKPAKGRTRTFKVWVHLSAGYVLFNWQTLMTAKEWRIRGFERATLTLTPPRRRKA